MRKELQLPTNYPTHKLYTTPSPLSAFEVARRGSMSELALRMEQHSRGLNIAQFVLRNVGISNADYGSIASILSSTGLGSAWDVSARDSGLAHRKISLPNMVCPVYYDQKLDVELKDEAMRGFKHAAIYTMTYRNMLKMAGLKDHDKDRRVGVGHSIGSAATVLACSTIPYGGVPMSTVVQDELQSQAFDNSMMALYSRDVLQDNLGVSIDMAQLANDRSPLATYAVNSMTTEDAYNAFDTALGIYGVSR